MTKHTKLLLLVLVLSVPLWVGVNELQQKIEDHIYEENLALNPLKVFESTTLLANIAGNVGWDIEQVQYRKYPELSDYNLQAKASIVMEVDKDGHTNIIFEKNIDSKLPIASLTKLMTAVTMLDFYQETEQIEISRKAVAQLERTGYLKSGEILLPEELLHIMLIESSNDAAYAATDLMGDDGFLWLMNLKAKEFGMDDSYFFNTHGLDPEDTKAPAEETNYSTVTDLTTLALKLLKEYPDILEISSKETYDLYLENGSFHHTLYNTNELLYELSGNVVASKTGLTDKAGGCLFLILKGTTPGSYYVIILLNSPNRFIDMRKLISMISNK